MLNPHSTAPAGSTFWGAAKREKSLRDVTVQMDIDSHLNGFIGNHGDWWQKKRQKSTQCRWKVNCVVVLRHPSQTYWSGEISVWFLRNIIFPSRLGHSTSPATGYPIPGEIYGPHVEHGHHDSENGGDQILWISETIQFWSSKLLTYSDAYLIPYTYPVLILFPAFLSGVHARTAWPLSLLPNRLGGFLAEIANVSDDQHTSAAPMLLCHCLEHHICWFSVNFEEHITKRTNSWQGVVRLEVLTHVWRFYKIFVKPNCCWF